MSICIIKGQAETTIKHKENETMKTKSQTALEALLAQQAIIMEAIELLESESERITEEVDPENVDWNDVAQFAKIADLSRQLVNAMNER